MDRKPHGPWDKLASWAFAPLTQDEVKKAHEEQCDRIRIMAGLPPTVRVTSFTVSARPAWEPGEESAWEAP
jgi:hypothetical protein